MLKNLTPHEVIIDTPMGVIKLQPEAITARVTVREKDFVVLNEEEAQIQVIRQEFGEVVGLPEQEEGITLIVSALVLSRVAKTMKGRAGVDVFAPDIGSTAIRDEKRNIIAVTRLTAGEV